jgi:hypothetical protein
VTRARRRFCRERKYLKAKKTSYGIRVYSGA